MSDVRLLKTNDIGFRESQYVTGLAQSEGVRLWWERYSRTHPTLFNGPVIACRELVERSGGLLEVEWYRTDYAHYLLRAEPTRIVPPARAIFCSVLIVTAEGQLVLCRMGEATSAPRRLQLPGGNIEIPSGSMPTLATCQSDARRELAEEIGIDIAPEELRLWRVKSGGDFDDVGLIFIASSPITAAAISAAFERHCEQLRKQGATPEISSLVLASRAELIPDGPRVDYLMAVVEEALAADQRERPT